MSDRARTLSGRGSTLDEQNVLESSKSVGTNPCKYHFKVFDIFVFCFFMFLMFFDGFGMFGKLLGGMGRYGNVLK